MKKKILFMMLAGMLLPLFSQPAYADVGPKPSVDVVCSNMPEGEVCLDLLINAPPLDEGQGFRYELPPDEPDERSRKMLDILKAYNEDGWRPALVTGTGVPLFGEPRLQVENGGTSSKFSYIGVPDRFKVIVVTQDGTIVVSNVVEKKAFQAVVYFDYATGKAVERSPAAQMAKQLALTLMTTLVIEGLILLAFRFSLKQNWKPFVFVNLGTQMGLNILIGLANWYAGTMLAVVAMFLFEIVILIAESVLYAFLLKQHSRLRRVAYAIVANIVSFAAGFMILLVMVIV